MSTISVLQEGPVNALALNKDNSQVAIGGRNVFKVYSIEEDCFKEICNLRASKHLNLSFSCNDVAWSSTDDNYLATAATNGHVCVWNLTKSGKAMQEQVYQEHKRTVNKVNFHSSEPYRLISGSQDGTMRYFDMRCKAAVATFLSNTESVRDVQFSPHMPHTFAAVSENGSVQLWDVRRTEKCIQQFTAHSGPIFACDWHPEATWLATASRDKTIKVWDLTTSKPTLDYTIHTIASIGHVKWRPQRKYHIASCALVVDCSINIWDIRRPFIPFAAFNEHKDIASGVAWRGDSQVFLSTSRDCSLIQHSFKDASRPASKANIQALDISTKGNTLFGMRVPVSTNTTKPTGLMRKSSTSTISDQFHQSASVLHQFTHVSVCNDLSSFEFLAKNYILYGRSFPEMCEHNAAVAKECGKSNISTIWKIVNTMYGELYVKIQAMHNNGGLNLMNNVDASTEKKNNDVVGEAAAAQFSSADDDVEGEDQVDHTAVANGYHTYNKYGHPKGDFSFGENELDLELDALSIDYRNGMRNQNQLQQQEDWTLPNEAFNIRHEIRDRSPPPEQFPNNNSPDFNDDSHSSTVDEQPTWLVSVSKIPPMPIWDPSASLIESLKHHAEKGDVQTSVSVLIVLGEHRKNLKTLDENTVTHWLMGYIQTLERFRLWNVKALVIELAWIPSISQMNQQSTRINTNCSQCLKPLQRSGWLCDRCHSTDASRCSICHQVVKGLYVWCQGCSHGGHLMHMQEWFSKNKQCPTGCGHLCEYR